MFKGMTIGGWRQFDAVDLEFHRRMTVLTGANGAGKTTILNVLNKHLGWNVQFVGTPLRRTKGGFAGPLSFVSGLWSRLVQQPDSGPTPIGKITYSDGGEAHIYVPASVSEFFSIDIPAIRSIPGIFVASHRTLYRYERVGEIATELAPPERLFQTYASDMMGRYTSGAAGRSPSYFIKQALISFAAFGYGNEIVERDEEAVATFEGFERVLRITLPPSLRFERFEIRRPEVVLITGSGDFPFDAVSGGISSIH